MDKNPVSKKMTHNADKDLEEEILAKHGKKKNQKLKPYLVMQYLLKYADENNPQTANDIVAYLDECGIPAERRSIYKDILEINKAMLVVENGIKVSEAANIIKNDKEEKFIVYDKSQKGFYVRQRHYDFNDIRLLAECIYSAKFLSLGQAERLASVVCEFVSEDQARAIQHDAFLTDRVKTDNKSVLNNISIINDAMSKTLDGMKHEPEKISFQYLKYSIKNMSKQVERRKGAKYIVSPYKLLINDGNYYLLAFDDYSKSMRTYRVDRMKSVSFTGEPREGKEAFSQIDLKSYTKRVFSMFGGDLQHVTIRFITPLLDTVVDRFGTKDVFYSMVDDNHFKVTVDVEISDQFFSWICGFRKKAVIEYPPVVVERFKKFVNDIAERYD